MTLTRREFIKHSGIAAGALVVTSAAPLPAWAEEKGGKILSAGRWGAMNVEVKDGKIVSSTGALAKTIPNSLQSTAADQVHTTARIQHPMVRKSYLDNPLQPAKGRGEDTYVQVSWEQAFMSNMIVFVKLTDHRPFLPDLTAGDLLACCIKRKPYCNVI